MVRDDLSIEELNELPNDAVVLDKDNDAWQKYDDEWYAYGENPLMSEELLVLEPIALVWEGENG